MVMSWCCHGIEARNRAVIDSYDDLLLSEHRFVAQLAVFASGEQFKFMNFRRPENWKASVPSLLCTVCFRILSIGIENEILN